MYHYSSLDLQKKHQYSRIFFQNSIHNLYSQFICITTKFYGRRKSTLHKKWSFPLRISSVNVTKSAGNWSHLLKKPLMENFIFCAVQTFQNNCIFLIKKDWHFYDQILLLQTVAILEKRWPFSSFFAALILLFTKIFSTSICHSAMVFQRYQIYQFFGYIFIWVFAYFSDFFKNISAMNKKIVFC